MSADDLSAELLSSAFDADPLAGSLYGFSGYDNLLPDLGTEAQAAHARALESIARRSAEAATDGLEESEFQTLDFVRCMARGMADAATVPMIEFTICDTFVAPVGAVFNALPKLQLDTEERREGYLARMHGLPGLLETAAQRHRDGAAAGRTAVARLVDSAITQLDMLLEDPSLGGIARPDQDDVPFAESLAEVVADDVRPALSAYREALRNDILPTARDDQHPGICFLPDGEQMYGILARLHTSMTFSPDELHAMGRRIVEEVHEELKETAQRLWNTTDITDIFERLSNDPSLRYESREEMLEHARRVVAAAEAEAPSWFAGDTRSALCGRARSRGRGGGHGSGLLHARCHRRLSERHVLPQHLQACGAAPVRLGGHRLPRGGARPPLPADDRDGVGRSRAGPTGAL